MNVFAKLSVGYLADRAAQAIGWSPIAKTVAIAGVEGPSASLFEGVTGTVRSVHGSVMTIEPEQTLHPAWSEVSRLRLTARHEGWTPFSLCLGPIAVVIEADRMDGNPGPVAIGTATVMRRSGRTPRD